MFLIWLDPCKIELTNFHLLIHNFCSLAVNSLHNIFDKKLINDCNREGHTVQFNYLIVLNVKRKNNCKKNS